MGVRNCRMTTATIAVKGKASNDVPADYATVHFGHEFSAPARSEALAGGNVIIGQLRETVTNVGPGVREIKVQSLRVHEMFNHVGSGQIREHAGWTAQLGGQLSAEPEFVSAVCAALIKVGVTINQLTWHLDPDTEFQAQRAVRRLAVTDARDAANDFAIALGAQLGRLIALADPGLLGATSSAIGTRSAMHMGFASALSGTSSWDEYVDIDPEMITISANVEASYEVNLP
jgi:uncharacterized protein YggE